MAGEVDIVSGYEFNEVDGEELTLEKLNRQLRDATALVRALSITAAQIANGSITSDKLAEDISAQLGVPDGSITVGKLASGFICPENKGGTGATTVAGARVNLDAAQDTIAKNKSQAVKTDTQSLTGTTAWTDITDLSVSITPTAATSKIRLRAAVYASDNVGAAAGIFFRLMRDTTAIGVADAAGSRIQAGFMAYETGATVGVCPAMQEFDDSPASTSAITYKVQMMITNASWTAYVNRSVNDSDTASFARFVSSLTVEEVPV